jgi:hypothetical protein
MGSSTISLGLGLGGGKSATSSGTSGGGSTPFANQYSVSFDGSDDSIVLSTSVSFSGECTFSTWIKPSVSGASVFLGQVASNVIYMFISSQNITFVPKIGVSTITTSGVTISNGSWYHVLVIRDASNSITIYVDGVSRATGSYSGSMTLPTSMLPSSYPYAGLADEYAVWDSDQSANISSLYNSGVPADITSLSPVNWWRMGDINGASGVTITDQGSGGNNATLTNGPTYSTTVPS